MYIHSNLKKPRKVCAKQDNIAMRGWCPQTITQEGSRPLNLDLVIPYQALAPY